jgi:hypothetical protein
MRKVARSAAVALLTFGTAVLLALSATMSTTAQLLGTYLLKPTQAFFAVTTDEDITQLGRRYIAGTYGEPPSPLMVVKYPASLFPVSTGGIFDPTFDKSVAVGVTELSRDAAGDPTPVLFGYSQGAVVITNYKRNFNQQYANPAPGTKVPDLTAVLIGNPDRPNGGLLMRFKGLYLPIVDFTFSGATPTETAGAATGKITTFDITRQYDFFADFPNSPLNLLSVANAVAGFFYAHLDYSSVGMNDAVLQDHYGDTAYYMIPATRLPLLMPFKLLGVPDPLLAALDAPLRVLVEAGYDRTISPGDPTPAGLFPAANPLQVAANFVAAIPTGWDDALQELGIGRPFGTTPAGPYGVGGPPVTVPDIKLTTVTRTPPSIDGSAATPSALLTPGSAPATAVTQAVETSAQHASAASSATTARQTNTTLTTATATPTDSGTDGRAAEASPTASVSVSDHPQESKPSSTSTSSSSTSSSTSSTSSGGSSNTSSESGTTPKTTRTTESPSSPAPATRGRAGSHSVRLARGT